MYGTVARLQVLPGRMAELLQLNRELAAEIDGLRFEYAYAVDGAPHELVLMITH